MTAIFSSCLAMRSLMVLPHTSIEATNGSVTRNTEPRSRRSDRNNSVRSDESLIARMSCLHCQPEAPRHPSEAVSLEATRPRVAVATERHEACRVPICGVGDGGQSIGADDAVRGNLQRHL